MTIYERTNIHPNYRSIGLHHIRGLRRLIREGRYTIDARNAIKAEQIDLLFKRRALAAAKEALAK